jgi:hypothetical protein
MNQLEADLYRRICDFDLDDRGAIFPFSQKLAREYQWTSAYTLRAIQEYKNFMFLGMVSDQIVSPSVPIDLVWHLHLIYTHSYWNQFCGEVLGKPFHHSPSSGGKSEKLKYDRLYQQTLIAYQLYFGTPPADIWINAPVRRSSKKYWIVPNLIDWIRLKN